MASLDSHHRLSGLDARPLQTLSRKGRKVVTVMASMRRRKGNEAKIAARRTQILQDAQKEMFQEIQESMKATLDSMQWQVTQQAAQQESMQTMLETMAATQKRIRTTLKDIQRSQIDQSYEVSKEVREVKYDLGKEVRDVKYDLGREVREVNRKLMVFTYVGSALLYAAAIILSATSGARLLP